jgi:DNA (cytosine-5)-methyltransferase 1
MPTDAVVSKDIERFLSSEAMLPGADVVVGGPPCQGFSTANRQRLSADPRNHLYKRFLEVVGKVRPKAFLMENVYGIMSAVESVTLEFDEVGYAVHPFVVDAKDFGVPQSRRRVFFLGVRSRNPLVLTHAVNVFGQLLDQAKRPETTLWEAVHDLPALSAKRKKNATDIEVAESGFTVCLWGGPRSAYAAWLDEVLQFRKSDFLYNHRSKFNNERDVEIYGRLSPGEDSTAESIRGLMPYEGRQGIFKDKFFKLLPDKPCKTITAHMYYDCHMYIHPYQARGLTPREAARVQGFPDGYTFSGVPNEWYRQVGNAVSPVVGAALGRALSGLLSALSQRGLDVQ